MLILDFSDLSMVPPAEIPSFVRELFVGSWELDADGFSLRILSH